MGNPLKEMGIQEEKITVEHELKLSLGEGCREPVMSAISIWGETSRLTLETLQIVGCGVASYLLLSGISKLVDTILKARFTRDKKNDDDE